MKHLLFFTSSDRSHVRVCINRPEALNAINYEVMDELEQVLSFIEENPVVIFELFTHENGYLASGGDLKAFSELKSESDAYAMAKRMATILTRIERLPCLTLVSLNGRAYGGGAELCLAFDLLYCTTHALLGFTQARFNVTPGWNGTARLLQRIGKNKTLDLLLNKRELKGEAIFLHGIATSFAHHLHDIDKEIEKLARFDRQTLLAIKKSVNLFDSLLHSDDKKEQELTIFAQTWASEAHHSAVEAFLQKKHKKHIP